MKSMGEVVKEHKVMRCLTCGKCSAVCPVTRWETREYASPRLLVEKAVEGKPDAVFKDPLFWSCLTCRQCSDLCPSNVDFCGFVRDTRSLARANDLRGACTHGNVIQTWSKMMAEPEVHQNRLDWLDHELETDDGSDTLYFTGCLPYYHVLFKDLGLEGLEIARSAVRIMNMADIAPRVMENERCCGHDQVWEGDFETFGNLARLNIESFKSTGAGRIITTCPECAYTLKHDYPKYAEDHGLEVLHISQVLEQLVRDGRVALDPEKGNPAVTYQDPCRLGRHMGIYEAPRTLLRQSGLELREMNKIKAAALCCGTSCWTACGRVNKNIQTQRLTQAKQTGAGMLVTACVKCQIHLKCAQKDRGLEEDIGIEIRDLTTLMAERIK